MTLLHLVSRHLLLQVAHFCNSGSEANELALMMARLHTGNHDMLMLRNAYHGGLTDALLGTLGHSTWKFNLPTVRSAAAQQKGARSLWHLQTDM